MQQKIKRYSNYNNSAGPNATPTSVCSAVVGSEVVVPAVVEFTLVGSAVVVPAVVEFTLVIDVEKFFSSEPHPKIYWQKNSKIQNLLPKFAPFKQNAVGLMPASDLHPGNETTGILG